MDDSMLWVAFGYGAVAYYHFRCVLNNLQSYDTADTAILNSFLALTIGPLLFIPAFIYGKIDGLFVSNWGTNIDEYRPNARRA